MAQNFTVNPLTNSITHSSSDYNVNISLNSSITRFIHLLDTPTAYAGFASYFIKVNATEDGIEFVNTSSSTAWGGITGTLSDQTDLQSALDAKQATITDSDDITEGVTNLFLTSTERSNIATNDAKISYTDATDVGLNTAARHSHSNKALLDTYTQTEVDIADAISKEHTHSNKALLDTYTQTEVDIADAISKEHVHSNKAQLDLVTDGDHDVRTDNPHGVTATDVGLGNVANVDSTNASNLSSGTVPSSVLPPVALTTVQVAASEVAMLALTTEEGDVVVRSDENKSYMHNGGVAGTMADFTELQTPTDSVLSVNGETGTVVISSGDITQDANNKFLTDAEKTVIGNTSGSNSGDQTSIVGITGTKAEFDTAVTDGNILYDGDITQYTDELAQDAVGTILTDSSEIDFTYNDATPSIVASLVSGSVDILKLDSGVQTSLGLADSATQPGDLATVATTGSYSDLISPPTIPTVDDTAYNATTWNTNTDAPTKNAVRDKIETMDTAIGSNTAKDTNATHTGEVTGSEALTLDSTAISNKTTVTAVGTDYVMIGDTSDSGNLKKALISDFASAGGDMAASTYDPATIAEQLVGLTATQTLTNKTLTAPALTNPTGIDTGDVTEVTDKNYVTDAQQTVLSNTSGTNTGDKDDYADNVFRISDNTDASKKIALEASGITTATVRTITMPDTNVDLGDIATNNAKVTNVSTNLSEGTATTTTVDVNSSDGTNATLVSASTSRAGLLTKAKWDEIVANTAKVSYTDSVDVGNNTSFRTTPSTIITAGTNLSWSGNTLNATGGSGDLWSDPVNSNITFDTDSTYSIGTTTVRPTKIWTDDFDSNGTFEVKTGSASLIYMDGASVIFNNAKANYDTYIYGNSATVLAHFDASTLGVGINKQTPGEALDVVGNIAVTGTVDGIDIATDVAANTAKVTNATHTGDVTGDTVLTLDSTAISGQTLVTAVGTDHVLIEDATDGNLKKALVSDLTGTSGDLWTDPIDGDITVDTDGTYDIGTTTVKHAQIHADGFYATNVVYHPSQSTGFQFPDDRTFDIRSYGNSMATFNNNNGIDLKDNVNFNSNAIVVDETAGEALVAGDLCYLDASGNYVKADASAEATCDTDLLLSNATIGSGATGEFIEFGEYTTTGLTPGAKYYVSETAGAFTATAPTTSAAIVRFVGYAKSATVLKFKPDMSYVELS